MVTSVKDIENYVIQKDVGVNISGQGKTERKKKNTSVLIHNNTWMFRCGMEGIFGFVVGIW